MKQQLGVIVATAVMILAPLSADASERKPKTSTNPSGKQVASQPEDAGSRGDTAVHGFFQGWANGMSRGARAIGLDKDPLAGRLPGDNRPRNSSGSNAPMDADRNR